MASGLERRWYAESTGPSLLTPLAWAYGAVAGARRGAYRAGWLRSRRLTRPVVVIGNLTVGGTGKTPLTIYLAQQLGAERLKVGIVSRGYGRHGRGACRGACEASVMEKRREFSGGARRPPRVLASRRSRTGLGT